MNNAVKTAVFWAVVLIAGVLLWQTVKGNGNEQKIPEISYSQLLSEVEAGDVAQVVIANNELRGTRKDRSVFRAILPQEQQPTIETLRQRQVEIWFRDTPRGDWTSWLLNFAPLLLLAVLWFAMMRSMRTSGRLRQQANPGGITSQSSQ